ncbi:MAG: type I polyketide synthase [Acidobacteriaceae bacterium]
MSDFLSRISKLSPQRLALLAAELNERLEILEAERSEPIAIVGMGCRYPGGVNDAESFWKLLSQGVDAIREVPSDRWNADAFYDPNPDIRGKMTTRWGGFIDGHDQFDPKFFGIAPAEAVPMDPQQRLLLETTWEALEDAGIPPSSLAGSHTGVFIGICNLDYGYVTLRASRDKINAYFASGLSHAIAAGRISYLLGLEGPSLAVDTSCSASLMAVHLACQSLRRKESHLALAGGANLILKPEVTIALSQSRMMAPDGRCKPFSDEADGFVRAEGSGMIVLKRLQDAVQDGNQILAVIRGTAANQDGRSSGLTAPNGRSQETVIAAALADAGLGPDDLQYIEAHGTGTALGDPIEIGALGNVFAERSPAAGPLRVGSVKSNFGHLESAAGIAGLMKLVLSLQHRQIPPSLHCRKPNHRIEWDRLPIRVATRTENWPERAGKRAGGISSFGFSGTNVHVIVEEHLREPEAPQQARPLLFPLSAKSKSALHSIAARLGSHIAEHKDLSLAGIARMLEAGRSHFEHRFALTAASREELLEGLRSFANSDASRNLQVGKTASHAPRIGFLFSDYASLRANMGRELYETVPVFRQTIQRCEEVLLGKTPRPLSLLLYADPAEPVSALAPEFLPVASFAVQYALAEVWQSCGLEPALVLGTGTGECIAACRAGVVSMEDALLLLVELGKGNYRQAEERARQITPQAAAVPWFAAEPQQQNPLTTWLPGVASAVLSFSELQKENCAGYLAMASPSAFEEFDKPDIKLSGRRFSSLQGGPESTRALLEAAAGLYVLGCEFDFSTLYGSRVRMVSLPTYPFERERYWFDAEDSDSLVASCVSQTHQPDRNEDWLYELAWEPRPLSEQSTTQSFSGLLNETAALQPTPAVLHVDGAGTRIQEICAGYARTILEQLGWKLSAGKEFTLDTLCRELRIAPGRERILGRLLGILAEDGLLKRKGEVYRCTGRIDEMDPDSELSALKALYPEIETELAILKRCTGRTAAVLQGTCDPMQLVFAEGSIQEAEQIYQNSPLCRFFNNTAQEIMARAVGQSAGRSLRVLEIGGGTGATTAFVLPAIAQENIEYTFTDISPVFLTRAREKFQNFTGVHYKLLNIERSPLEQGFLAGGYDIVLAANVLHATQDLRQTVAHARQLLRPGGLLMLIEGVRPDRWLDMTFGLTDGWWRVADRELRSEHPLISSVMWQALFREQGMSVSRALQYESNDGTLSQQAVMLACVDEVETAARSASGPAKRWLIFSDESGVGVALAKLLTKCGEHCELIPETLGKPDSALQALRQQWPDIAFEIVYLCGVDALKFPDVNRNIQLCMQMPVRLMQAVAQDTRGMTHLWLVTRGAQATNSYSPAAAAVFQAMLWGAGRVFSLEHPENSRRIIDIDPNRTAEQNAADLLKELRHEDVEDQVAHRRGERLVPRLKQAPGTILASAPERLRADGAYLIVGGLGSVGLEVAKWAAKQGAGHLVLLSRSGLEQDGNRTRAVEEIQASGTPVTVISGDVASTETMQRVFVLFGSKCPELRGIFHVATTQSVADIAELSEQQIAEMLRPKVLGTCLLHEWTRDRALDFFVAFSSTTALLGSQGMAHYAAANQFLDNFAFSRRAQGLPMLSVNWGAWEQVQDGASTATSRLRQMGLLPMKSAAALQWMPKLIASSHANIMIADVNWKTLKSIYQARRIRPMLSEVGETAPAARPAAAPPPIPRMVGEEREQFVEQSVISASAKVLGFRAGEVPPLDVPLTDLGLDSLMAVDLRNRLQTALGRDLPPTIVFDYPTISALTGMLETMLWATEGSQNHDSLPLQDEIRI